jgi:hypothetical protein
MDVFRWYIARLDEDQQEGSDKAVNVHVEILPTTRKREQKFSSMKSGETAKLKVDDVDVNAHVEILPTTRKGMRKFSSMKPGELAKLEVDDVDWWVDAEEGLEGNVSVQALRRAVVTHNIRRLSGTDRQQARERGIVEEMVLLQIVPTEKGKRSSLMKMRSDAPGRPDVTALVDVKSRWLDFTRQARAMSQRLYSRALGGGAENAQ